MEVTIDFVLKFRKVETIRARGFLDVWLVNNGSIVTILLKEHGVMMFHETSTAMECSCIPSRVGKGGKVDYHTQGVFCGFPP